MGTQGGARKALLALGYRMYPFWGMGAGKAPQFLFGDVAGAQIVEVILVVGWGAGCLLDQG